MRILRALRTHVDLLIAGAVAIIFTVELLMWDATDPARAIPCSLLGTFSLALRRKLPLPGFLLTWTGMFGASYFAPGIEDVAISFLLVLLVSLYSLGAHAVGRDAWVGGLLVLAGVILFMISDGDSFHPGDVAFATALVGGPWAAGLAIRLRRERERALSARNIELEQEQAEQARRAVVAERSRIARELHDVVSHAIAVTVLQARGGRKMLGVDEDAVRRSLDAIEHTNAQALGDMRRLLSLLRDAEDDADTGPQPSLARLDALLAQVRDSGLPVDFSVTGDWAEVPPGVDLSAYRIIQEALTNVLKHAGPDATAKVQVRYGPDDLDVVVADTGAVPSNGDGRGHGLIGIRERVAVVGGQVEVGPGESGGFVVHAHLPYSVEA